MTKFLLFFFLGYSSCQMVFCDEQPLAGQKITYRHDVLKTVARSLPRRTKRLFWGTWDSQIGAPPLGIQLYESRNGLVVELWEKKQKNFVRINLLTGLSRDRLSPDAKFGVDFYWLDSHKKTTPILVLTKITYGNLMPGEYREITVISLASGWQNKASIQMFDAGDSNSGSEGLGLERDKKGMLKLSAFSIGNNLVKDTDTYAWDGKQFSVVPEERKTVDLTVH